MEDPVFLLYNASRKNEFDMVDYLLKTIFFFHHEFTPALLIACENANVESISVLVKYCREKYGRLPVDLEPQINWALSIGAKKMPTLEAIWCGLNSL